MEQKFTVEGVDKSLRVYENKVVLQNKKMRGVFFWVIFIALTFSTLIGGLLFYFFWNVGNGKEKTIYTKNIKSIELNKPSKLINGVMQFNLDDSANWTNDQLGENSISFRGIENYEKCVEIRDYIESLIA